jgi:molybdopterin synthase catalytic subunit
VHSSPSFGQELCDEVLSKWTIAKISLAHRTGKVDVGEASVIVAVSSAHRREALEVNLLP